MHVVVVGGGVIGLSIAWRSLERGLAVTVVDPVPGSGASWVSAGMLPGAHEMLLGRDDLLRLCMASRQLYPSYVEELEAVSGLSAGYRNDGMLDAAFDDASWSVLENLRSAIALIGVTLEPLTAAECLRHEPMLAPSVRGGLLAPTDGAINPRQQTGALQAAIAALGGTLIRQEAIRLLVDERAGGVVLADGTVVHADRVVLAAGCWTHLLDGLPPGVVPQVNPLKGQILRLRTKTPVLRHSTRALTSDQSVFLVPRHDGELVVGATHENKGYDTSVTVGGVGELLDRFRTFLPAAHDLVFAEASAGLRPTLPDGLPALGTTSVPDLLVATGHSRIGVQLAPVTADVMAELLVTGQLPDVAKPFAVDRFFA